MMRQRNHLLGDGWERQGSGLYLPPAPNMPDLHHLKAGLPTCIDLFAGCGGFSLGFRAAGFHSLAALEWDPIAAHSYLINQGSPDTVLHVGAEPPPGAGKDARRFFERWGGQTLRAGEVFAACGETLSRVWDEDVDHENPGGQLARALPVEHFWLCDVRQVTGDGMLAALGRKRGEVTAVIGGPPCQGFSHAGRRNVMDPRNSLVFEFARLVLEIQPVTMCMENVPGILGMVTPEGLPVVEALCRELEAGGWSYSRLRQALTGKPDARAAWREERDTEAPTARAQQPAAPAYEVQDLFAEVGV